MSNSIGFKFSGDVCFRLVHPSLGFGIYHLDTSQLLLTSNFQAGLVFPLLEAGSPPRPTGTADNGPLKANKQNHLF